MSVDHKTKVHLMITVTVILFISVQSNLTGDLLGT